MKSKIIATFMALGMVLTGFSILAMAEDSQPVPTATPLTNISRALTAGTVNAALEMGAVDQPNGVAYSWLTAQLPVLTVSMATFGWVGNPQGVPCDGRGGWTANVAYGQASYDAGSPWDAYTIGDAAVMIYEVFNTNNTALRNYTCIFEQQLVVTSTNFGSTTGLAPISNPVTAWASSANNTAGITIAQQVGGVEVATLLDGYRVYKSTTGPITQSNQGVALGDATLMGGSYWQYIDPAFTTTSYYAVKVKWDGGTYPFAAPWYSYGMSNDTLATYGGAATFAPETQSVLSTPAIHNGNTVTESVTITATITDTEAPADIVNAATLRIDGVNYTMAAVDGSFNSASEAVTYTFNFPTPYATGLHTYEIRGSDNGDGWNATWASGSFTITDTTNSIQAYTAPTPAGGSNAYIGSTVYVRISYEDFTNYTAATAQMFYRLNLGAYTPLALNMVSFAWGSYLVGLQASFLVGGVAGDTYTFYTSVDDIGGGAPVVLATRTINVVANAGNVVDPYPVYGVVTLYNGNAGVYTPILQPGVTVSVTWWNTSLPGPSHWSTITTTSLAVTAQYSVDIGNYTNGDPIFCNATALAPYGNLGSNATTVDISLGGRQQNIICGVPYNVLITAPAPLANVVVSAAFPVTYRIVDRFGVLAQGYYSFTDGLFNMRDMGVALFTPPANFQFNGIATGGQRTDNFIYLTPGLQTFNVSEGGLADANPYLTPWGANVVYLKDWALLQVNVLGGGFNWHLHNGWNLVSVPADPIGKGTNALFGSFDALALCFAVSNDATLKAAQRNLGTNPSTYVNFDYGMAEAGEFAMGSTLGYWIFTTTVLSYDVNVLALNYTAGSNVVNLALGWNLLGFTHNMGVTGGTGWGWVAQPTAASFTNGGISAGLAVPALAKIVATWWNAVPQWYNSYVVTPTFPGMATHNWVYDTAYAYGYWVWVSAPVAVTFNVNY
jgi:hypothetical protein